MHSQFTASDIKRFERCVDRSGGRDACHPWTGHCNQDGYGVFKVGGHPGRRYGVHRVAWVLAGNEITPEKPCVLHSCDNPPCCISHHLNRQTGELEDCFLPRFAAPAAEREPAKNRHHLGA